MMNQSVKVLFVKELNEWREILNACGVVYKITNLSDYSGTEFLIEWAE